MTSISYSFPHGLIERRLYSSGSTENLSRYSACTTVRLVPRHRNCFKIVPKKSQKNTLVFKCLVLFMNDYFVRLYNKPKQLWLKI